MQIFFKLLSDAIQENLIILVALMFTMAILEIADLGLGFYIGVIDESFKWKKLWFGILKRIVLLVCVLLIGYGTNLFGLIVELFIGMFGGVINTNIIVSFIEIALVVFAWVIDLLKDLYNKLKNLKTLKYIKYEDVGYNEGTGITQ